MTFFKAKGVRKFIGALLIPRISQETRRLRTATGLNANIVMYSR